MAIKVPYSYTAYKNFPVATEASRKRSLGYGFIVLLSCVLAGILLSFDLNDVICIAGPVVFCVIGILINKGRTDPDIINGVFTGLNGISPEQRKLLVDHFMNGKKLGTGDVASACMVATWLKNIDLELRNHRISADEYAQHRHDIITSLGVTDLGS